MYTYTYKYVQIEKNIIGMKETLYANTKDINIFHYLICSSTMCKYVQCFQNFVAKKICHARTRTIYTHAFAIYMQFYEHNLRRVVTYNVHDSYNYKWTVLVTRSQYTRIFCDFLYNVARWIFFKKFFFTINEQKCIKFIYVQMFDFERMIIIFDNICSIYKFQYDCW